jgi:flagellar biosynthesis GTPase FlhF
VSGRANDAQDANTRPVRRGGLAKFAAGFLLTMLAVLMLGSASAAEGARRRLRRTVGYSEGRGLMRVRISENSLATRAIMMVVALGMILAGCGSSGTQTGSKATTTTTAPTEPSVSLHLNTGSYTTNDSKTTLSGTVTPGAKVTLTVTSPSELAEGSAAAKPASHCGEGVKDQNCEVVQTIPALVRGDRWIAGFPVFLGDVAWQSGQVARGEKTAVEAENVVMVRARKSGLAPTSASVTIIRGQTPAQHAAEEKAKTQRLKEEEANPNSEFNKNEHEAEAKVKKAEKQTKEELRPSKEAEERNKNLEAKQVEEHVREEESREQRRLESEGK